MKHSLQTLPCLLLALILLLSFAPAVLAEESGQEESLIDEAYLNEWIEGYRQDWGIDHDWQEFSVGFCYTATGDCWFYNPDVFMYSASMYKVPVCMMISEQIRDGEYGWSDTIQGSTAEYLVDGALIRSNNDYGHVLVSYLGGSYYGKCSDQSIRYTDLDEDYFPPEFFEKSYYSVRFMTQLMRTLYEGGEERFPRVIPCLLQAQPDEYMNLSLKGRWDVAQKYGAYDEQNGYNNNHDAAIVYTPTPIVVVVMTRNVGYYQDRIADVAEFLADYSLELDEKLARREQEALEAAARATPSPPTPTECPTASPAPSPAETSAPTETPAPPLPSPAPEEARPEENAPLPPGLWVILGALALLAIPVLRHALLFRRKKARSR